MDDHKELHPFAVWLKAHRILGKTAAVDLGVKHPKLSKVLNGHIKADADLIHRIWEYTSHEIDANAMLGVGHAKGNQP